MSDFLNWLNEEIRARRLSNNEVARLAGISSGLISMVSTGKQPPSLDFCLAIADALQKPREMVLRKAGFLPPLPGPASDPLLQELMDVTKQFDGEGRRDILEYARLRYRLLRERQATSS